MNFTIGTTTESWSQKVRQAIQVAAVGGVLTTTALLAGGVFESSSRAPSLGMVESQPASSRPLTRLASSPLVKTTLVNYLVNTQAEVDAIHAMIAGETLLLDAGSLAALSYNVLVVNSEGAWKDAMAQLVTANAELREAGVMHTVVDLR